MADKTTGQTFEPETSEWTAKEFVEKFGDPSWKFALEARRPFERMALLGLLFAGGQQNMDVVETNRQFFTRRNLSMPQCETAQRTNNRIPIYLRSISAAFMSNLPDFEGVPDPFDLPDGKPAQNGTRALRWRDREDDEENKRKLALSWALTTGPVFRFTKWNTKLGRRGWNEGDVDTQVVPLFNMAIDPYSPNVWPPRWLIHYDARHVDEIKAMYPGQDVEAEDVSEVMQNLDRLAMNIPGAGEASRERAKDHAMLKRMYCPPSERYPNGRVWISAGKVLLDTLELQGGIWPWSKFGWFELAGRLYDMGLVEWLISDQRQLNLMLSQLQEVATRQLRGDVLFAGTGTITEIVIDAKTGRKQITLPPNTQKFEMLQYNQVWNNAAIMYEWLLSDQDAKAGQSRPTMGQTLEKEARVGELQLAIERDLGMLGWHMDDFADGLVEIDEQKLALIAEFMQNDRLMTLYGKDQLSAEPYFSAMDMGHTRKVIAVPVPRLTPAMKRQALYQAAADGWLPPYPSPEVQLRGRTMLRKSGLTDIEEQLALVYGPYEDLQAYCSRLNGVQQEVLMAQAETALEMVKNPVPAESGGMGDAGTRGRGDAGMQPAMGAAA